MTRLYAILAAGVAALAVVGTAAYVILARNGGQFAECNGGHVAGGAELIGGPFTLTSHTGSQMSEADVIDGLTLVYFGYTFCPDICPFDMARNAEAVELLEERGILVKPVMITVDPLRDTPEVIGNFATAMHPRAVGLTGSEAEVEVAKNAYRVYGARASDDEDYLVDHTTLTYLMAPEHGFLGFFRRDLTPEDMADKVACFAERV